jgi:multidrug resistance efflux pump
VRTVAVGVVREQLLEKTIQLPATIESDETAMLMARVEAYVEKVGVDIGDEVAAGQVLVRLRAPELRQAVETSRATIQQLRASDQVLLAELTAARSQLDVVRAQLKLKRSERERRSRLVSTGAIAEQLLEESAAGVESQLAMLAKYESAVGIVTAKLTQGESELAVGHSKLKQAETMAAYLEIKAPFAGVVAERNVDPGNLVRSESQSSGMKPLLILAKVDKLRAVLHATTDVAGQLAVGQLVKFAADDMPGTIVEGRLSRMAGTYNQKTRMMQAQVDLENAPDPATGRRPLRAGSYGSATIVLQSATLPVVPESAVRTRGDRTSVVIVREGICMVTPVTVAFASGELAAIAKGLAAGEQVIVEPDGIHDEQLLKDSEIKNVSW